MVSDSNSIINLGDLSRPATVLIEKISNAVGVIYEPTRMKRQARAEAESEKIKALARIELSDLERRAFERLAHQESRKQENIERITDQAISTLPPDAKVDSLDEDWVANFFKQCDTVSDKEMQSLWGKLLAGEATAPGTFSKRTVEFVSSIDKRDAHLFTAFCQFVWMIGDPTPLIYDLQQDIYSKAGITFDSLKHLDAIGLISYESVAGYKKMGFGKYVHFFYYGTPVLVEFPLDTKNEIQLGHVLLTATGKELVAISGSTMNAEFKEWVLNKWINEGLVLSSIIGAVGNPAR
jgi:hypothetical protein